MSAEAGIHAFETPLGACGIAWRDGRIAGVQLPEADEGRTVARLARSVPGLQPAGPPAWVIAIEARIRALLAGEPDDLADVPLALEAVPEFHQRVYAVTRAIPPGRTLTYGEVARAVGEPGASRAVGQALGHNPFAPVVPCHRVLAANNASGGFSADGGVRTKLKMLEIERARFGGQAGLFDSA